MSSSAPTADYGTAWETFWGSLSDDPQDVLWNASHEQAVALDWDMAQPFFTSTPELPLVDMGCGDGTQTHYFRGKMKRTIGVDVSAAAIHIANQHHNEKGNKKDDDHELDFQVLDLLNSQACSDFREHELKDSDAHIYMRGVLMQFSTSDHRVVAAANLKTLMGASGCLYMHEYVPETKAYYGSLFQKLGGMPAGFKRVLDSGIVPGGIAKEEITSLFPADDYDILKEENHVMSTIIAVDDNVARAPGFAMVLRKKKQT